MSDKKPRRERTPANFCIQRRENPPQPGTSAVSVPSWVDVQDGFKDTRAAEQHLREQGIEGEFRIVAIKKVVTAKKETVAKMVLT